MIFNRQGGKTQTRKVESEWIKVPVPAIVDEALFDKAVKPREAHSPKKINPRVVSSPTLLTGLIRCSDCGAGMVVATGKSGRYRYDKCSNRMSRGNAARKSGNKPLEKLDTLVLDALRQRVYTPEYLQGIISRLRKQAAKGSDQKPKLKQLEKDLAATEQALDRLYEAVEQGVMRADDHLKARLDQHRVKRENLLTELTTAKRQEQSPLQTITPQKIKARAKYHQSAAC